MKDINKEIENIINMEEKPNESLFVDLKPATLKEYQVKALSNLLTKQVEETLRDFVEYLYENSNKVGFRMSLNRYLTNLRKEQDEK